MKTSLKLLSLLAVLSLAAPPLWAQIITVPNFSFQTPASAKDTETGGETYNDEPTEETALIEDWTATSTATGSTYGTINYASDSNGYTNGTGSQGAAIGPHYTNSTGYLTTGNATNYDSTAGQTGYVTTVSADTTYILTVDVAAPPSSASNGGTFSLNLIDSTGAVFASTTYNNSSLSTVLTPFTLTYTSTAAPTDLGDGLQIQLGVYAPVISAQDFISNAYDVFDNVQLTSATPEPPTWVLMLGGMGFLAFIFVTRRKGLLA